MVTTGSDNALWVLAGHYAHCYELHQLRLAREDVYEALLQAWDSWVRHRALPPHVPEVARRAAMAFRGQPQQNSAVKRLELDLEWLVEFWGVAQDPMVAVDLGAGERALGDAISTCIPLREYIAIDKRCRLNREGQVPVTIVHDFKDVRRIETGKTLIIARYVLHHVPEGRQAAILRVLRERCGHGGWLLVVEDCVDEKIALPLCSECAAAAEQWPTLDPIERLVLMSANDLWSNVLVYGRALDDQEHAYRTVTGWKELLARCGFSVLATAEVSFTHSRLHGVPAVRAVAKFNG